MLPQRLRDPLILMPHSNASLAQFVQHVPVAAALLDRSLAYVMTSTRWGEVFDLPVESIRGTAHFSVFAPGETRWHDRLTRALGGAELKGTDSPLTRVSGHTYWVDWELRPWYAPDGTIIGVAFFAEDHTERKRALDAQRRSEANLNAILDSSIQAFVLLDNDYRIVATNRLARRYAEQIAGEPAEEGRPLLDYVPADLRDRFRAHIDRALSEQERETTLWEAPSGTWFEIAYAPVREGESAASGLCISLTDVTARQRAEQAQQRYSELLEHRNRDLQEFAYVASHDLQEPLRKVRAFSSLLTEEYGDAFDGTASLYIDRIAGASGRMSALINALLSYARVSTRSRAFDTVDLASVVEDVVSDLEIQIAESSARVDVGALPVVVADETQMRQLFQNLIGNALKFHRPGEPPVVRVVQRAPTGTLPGGTRAVEVVIQDQGIGFEPGEAEHIFDPFRRLHGRAEYEGTGMGLAICRRIAERHGGHLSAAAEPGSGATFVLRLPALSPTAPDAPEPAQRHADAEAA